MDQFSPLIPIEQYAFIKTFTIYILLYHFHPYLLRSPLSLLTCLKSISFTHRTGASVVLRRRWHNHRRRVSLIFFFMEATPILLRISSFLLISSRVATHPTKYAYLYYTHLLSMISLFNPTFCVILQNWYNRSQWKFPSVRTGYYGHIKLMLRSSISISWLGSYDWHHCWFSHLFR